MGRCGWDWEAVSGNGRPWVDVVGNERPWVDVISNETPWVDVIGKWAAVDGCEKQMGGRAWM